MNTDFKFKAALKEIVDSASAEFEVPNYDGINHEYRQRMVKFRIQKILNQVNEICKQSGFMPFEFTPEYVMAHAAFSVSMTDSTDFYFKFFKNKGVVGRIKAANRLNKFASINDGLNRTITTINGDQRNANGLIGDNISGLFANELPRVSALVSRLLTGSDSVKTRYQYAGSGIVNTAAYQNDVILYSVDLKGSTIEIILKSRNTDIGLRNLNREAYKIGIALLYNETFNQSGPRATPQNNMVVIRAVTKGYAEINSIESPEPVAPVEYDFDSEFNKQITHVENEIAKASDDYNSLYQQSQELQKKSHEAKQKLERLRRLLNSLNQAKVYL